MSTIWSPNKYAGRVEPIELVVIHTMEVDENDPNVAEAVGSAFSKPSRKASAHVGSDTNSDCRYVSDGDTAWAAPGANANGLQMELAGRAGQVSGQWQDAASLAILERGAQQTATWCRLHNIPAVHLTDAQLAAGQKGIVGHDQVSRVFHKSSHWDPGPSFPWNTFIARVLSILGGAAPVSSPVTAAPAVAADPNFGYSAAQITEAQHLLNQLGAGLAEDGWLGVQTRGATETFQRAHGLVPDGIPGPLTVAALKSSQALTALVGLDIDGIFGDLSKKALQRALGVAADGIIGKATTKALQRRVGADDDGKWGVKTTKALQRYLGVADDGIDGEKTYKALQRRLNAGTF